MSEKEIQYIKKIGAHGATFILGSIFFLSFFYVIFILLYEC